MKILSIIIPAFNEERTLKKVIDSCLSLTIPAWQTEIVVVNDASVDGTKKILDSFGNKIKTYHLEKNSGKGTAVLKGISIAKGDYLIIQDADLEYNPQEIPSLVLVLKDEKQVVYGSRNHNAQKRTGFYIPRAGVWFITKMINLLYGLSLTDVWTCYKLFPRESKHLFLPGKFDSELLFTTALARNKYSFLEVPISHNPRTKKEGKKIRYRDGIYGIFLLIKDYIRHL